MYHLGSGPIAEVPFPTAGQLRRDRGAQPLTRVVWSIAGFDPSSGAGITADLMTFAAHGLFGCSALTALTVQSTTGVRATELVSPTLLQQTLKHLQADLPPAGVKIGMLGGAGAAEVVGGFMASLAARSGLNRIPVVLDPVLRSSSGRELFPEADLPVLRRALLPHVDWVTPNWSELELLAETRVATLEGAEAAARLLQRALPGLGVVVTGGDQSTPTDLMVMPHGECFSVSGEHIETTATHGTGCAFSSALLARLVDGAPAQQAVHGAKHYVSEAMRRAPGLGHGKGPLELLWPLRQGEIAKTG